MNTFLFITIAITALTIFVCIYSYSLQFFTETKKELLILQGLKFFFS